MPLRTATSTLAVLALTVPAFADVSPAEVWQNWVEYYQANGYSVTEGAREEAGDTLTLRDVALAYQAAEPAMDLRVVVPEISMQATGDGRVRTTMSETIPITAAFDADGDDVTLIGALTTRDADIVSSGSAEDMAHESRMGEVVVALQTVTVDGDTKDVPVALALANLTSKQQITRTDALRFAAEIAADRMTVDADLSNLNDDDGDPVSIKVTGGLDDLRGASAGVLPLDLNPSEDMAAALRGGMDVDATFAVGTGRFDFDFSGTDDDGETRQVVGGYTIDGTELSVGLGAQGLKYQGAIDATAVELTIPDIPGPIAYSLAETTFDIQVPVLKSDEPAPFKLAYSIGKLTLGDAIWDLFDAERVLPRDPASIDVDVTGLVRLAMDLFDPALAEAAGNDESDQPFEPVEVALNKIALSAVGASFDSSGELRIPEGGDVTQPVGHLNARIEGLNGLIDRLVQLGVVGNEEVMSYRMMLAMFARPAPEGGDALVSEFEFREDGGIFANGQQVQ
ncbi:DUF2125 domain-containing protein [Paracoccus alkenifer]|uniref:DUF2125 domain-containing protein n=1 Tax=Paracoccus alkenifer TaxID=65735 RepID=A0A1H6M5F4_9RHOB|nr:DUF2125 domain-containing protein [Paracoccus alkenifer]SEH96550.1 hypothetical protein SAMN04488075_1946 [Paracoccus alkenifer]